MSDKAIKNISQCQNALLNEGYFIDFISLPSDILELSASDKFDSLDKRFFELTKDDGLLFNYLKQFCPLKEIEFIISLREAQDEWEEDGIWHDDGSRMLAFSLSLTTTPPIGGVLEFRKKGLEESNKISTPAYGNIIVFKTGIDQYEHKINKVENGRRLIIAGWCT